MDSIKWIKYTDAEGFGFVLLETNNPYAFRIIAKMRYKTGLTFYCGDDKDYESRCVFQCNICKDARITSMDDLYNDLLNKLQ